MGRRRASVGHMGRCPVTITALPREPWRGSQICGHQTASGFLSDAFCPARKADGLPACQEHYDSVVADYGSAQYAPGNALGHPGASMALLWEPHGGPLPVVPTDEELSRYAGILGLEKTA